MILLELLYREVGVTCWDEWGTRCTVEFGNEVVEERGVKLRFKWGK